MAQSADKKNLVKRAGTTVKNTIPRSKRQIVAISVSLKVTTPDQLKKIIFGLTKGTKSGATSWTINFELYDRKKKADSFAEVIALKIDVNVNSDNLAEETADKGLNRPQVEHLITRAAPAASALKQGKISKKQALRTIESTLQKRNTK